MATKKKVAVPAPAPEPAPAKKKTVKKAVAKQVAAPVRRQRAYDPTDHVPSLPVDGEGRVQPTAQVRVVSVREWYDNWMLHKEGSEEILDFPLDSNGDPILNEHVVPADEYEPPEFDLPGTKLSKENRQKVRGGATGFQRL